MLSFYEKGVKFYEKKSSLWDMVIMNAWELLSLRLK